MDEVPVAAVEQAVNDVAVEEPPVASVCGFDAAASFDGPRPGCVFKLGDQGLGYYTDELPIPDLDTIFSCMSVADESGEGSSRKKAVLDEASMAEMEEAYGGGGAGKDGGAWSRMQTRIPLS
jgi:hypothetical protein